MRLAHGIQYVYAVRETESAARVPFGGTLRPGARDDLRTVPAPHRRPAHPRGQHRPLARGDFDDVRGSGAGLALTAHVLGWAYEHGFRSITTDWRSVNLRRVALLVTARLASHALPALPRDPLSR